MGKRKEHIKHTLERYPEFNKELVNIVHAWMDDPATWVLETYESGYTRKHGYNSNHRKIRHDPIKVANALSGTGKKRTKLWKTIYLIAEDHCRLDGIL